MINTRGTVRISVVQLDEYGPWTVEPSPRRETDLQALQARLYADFADFVGRSDGYAFFNRFDNMLGIANGIDVAEYERFQERVRNQYPITVSVGVGEGETPVRAVEVASQQLQDAGSAQDPDRREVLNAGDTSDSSGYVTVGHFDIVDVTESFTDTEHAATAGVAIQQSMLALKQRLLAEYDSVAQFVGGDNMIAVCPQLSEDVFGDVVDHVYDQTGIEFQVGIGSGPTAHGAGNRAKEALEHCRETGTRVHEATPIQQQVTDD
ncbi:GTP cyclohydrolase III [Halorubrum coriense DSM 10284]|uniref:GTP cyclohydrolase III n=1 Tax=Halorubrum coriense DSM 10284 TaxID=1227466 RepID=M0ERV5_9EURY|nr:GTP cyclohydrolase IIa [Halorubrum coriense]ELZ49627.1 GTP cyclohydrolase III [Halorubrum coriense DSM 10284]